MLSQSPAQEFETSLLVMVFWMCLYLWLAPWVTETLKHSWIFPFLLINLPAVHKTLDNRSETVAGAVSGVKIIKFYLSIAARVLILIQFSSFNQSFFSSINSCFFTAWGNLGGERKRLSAFCFAKEAEQVQVFHKEENIDFWSHLISRTELLLKKQLWIWVRSLFMSHRITVKTLRVRLLLAYCYLGRFSPTQIGRRFTIASFINPSRLKSLDSVHVISDWGEVSLGTAWLD